MEYITKRERLSDIRTAGVYAGGIGLGSILMYFTLPRIAKESGRFFGQIAQSTFQKLRFFGSPRAFLGRLSITRTSGLIESNRQLFGDRGATPTKYLEVFPSPFESANLGETNRTAIFPEMEESFVYELGWALGGVAVFSVGGTLLTDAGFLRLISIVQNRIWAARLVSFGHKPSVFAIGSIGASAFFWARSKYKIRGQVKFLEQDIKNLKEELAKEKNLGTLQAYMKASRVVQDAVELSFIHSIGFLADVQAQEYNYLRNGHCWPYESVPFGESYEQNMISDLDVIFQGAQSHLDETRAGYVEQVARGQAVLNETLEFVKSLKRSEFFDLEGRLTETEYVLNAYGSDPHLLEMWKVQAVGQMQRSGRFRKTLDNAWEKFQKHQPLSASEIKDYTQTLQYIDNRIFNQDQSEDNRFTCLGLPGHPAVEMRSRVLGK